MALISSLMDAITIGGLLWLLSISYEQAWDGGYTQLLAGAVGLFFFFAQTEDLYRSWRGASMMRQEIIGIWVAWFWAILVILFFVYATKSSAEYSRRLILTWFLLTPIMLGFWRALAQTALGYMRERGINTRSVAIVGAEKPGARLARTLLDSPWMGLSLIGFYDDRLPTGSRPLVDKPVNVLGNLDELVRRAREGKVEIIYITLPMAAEKRIKNLIVKLSETTASVYIAPNFFISDLMKASWTSVGDIPAVSIFETPFYGVDGVLKRVEDFVLGNIFFLLALVPMIIVAIGVKLSSPGPIIFKQHRYGLQGNKIEVWKFRTMCVCEDGDDIRQVTENDSRVTKFGHFLRMTSLDELPQFINVVQGKMSIVGPRPHAVVQNEQYRKLINGYMLRYKVKPGITGLAQVNGWRGETDTLDKMQKRLDCDLDYIRNWSLWLDLQIIMKTVYVAFFGKKNAY
jgi:putative colanic acid biosynthesis UDP-glucose lipid carrier transferase